MVSAANWKLVVQEDATDRDAHEQIRENERRSGSHPSPFTAQRTIWPTDGPAPPQPCGIQASNQQSSWRTTARVAETSERSAGEVHRRDNLLGHSSGQNHSL